MMLIVVNGDATDPIAYSESVSSGYRYSNAISNANNVLSLGMGSLEMDDAYQELLHGRVYWFNEQYCFTAIA